jgi:hypothetical protein
MSRYKLRRCDLCKGYHVSYVVPDAQLGNKLYLCYTCWKASQAEQPARGNVQGVEDTGEPAVSLETDTQEAGS